MGRSNLDIRTVAFVTIALAVLGGLSVRIFRAIYFAPRTAFTELQPMNSSEGQSAGDAAFDVVDDDDFLVLRLRLKQCSEPVFAVPIPLMAVATPELADQRFLNSPHYYRFDVYDEKVWKELSYVSRVITPYLIVTRNLLDRNIFVRFYAPKDCNVPDTSYVGWADTILKHASNQNEANE
jgi:hypothetical protein